MLFFFKGRIDHPALRAPLQRRAIVVDKALFSFAFCKEFNLERMFNNYTQKNKRFLNPIFNGKDGVLRLETTTIAVFF